MVNANLAPLQQTLTETKVFLVIVWQDIFKILPRENVTRATRNAPRANILKLSAKFALEIGYLITKTHRLVSALAMSRESETMQADKKNIAEHAKLLLSISLLMKN